MKKGLLKRVFADTLPVLSGYVVLGIGFGIVLHSAGYGFPWALAMSVFIYAGSMQFVAVGLLREGASLLSFALTTLMVNCRHLFYGISMVDRYKNAGSKKAYLIYALTDETYSLVCREPEGIGQQDYLQYCFLVSLFDQCYWVCGSVLGALFGSVLTFNTEGIDFALTALFLTVFTEQWLSTKRHFPALAGLAATTGCRLVFGSSSFLIPSMLLITAILLAGKTFRREEPV